MLLSFAQFERDVTAERIRDKIAASKAKGMWMGGLVPLGYRSEGRKLVIEEEGHQPADLTARNLHRMTDLPFSWAQQRQRLAFH